MAPGKRPRPAARSQAFDRQSVEFDRALTFTDGLFAIAMTLLVVDLVVPTLSNHSSVGELAHKLREDIPTFVSFFISFAVIGRYWLAHHSYFSALTCLDRGLLNRNLVYLGFIAFLPFPTAILGQYFTNPLSITIYASNVAVISFMEVVLFSYARRHAFLEKAIPEDVYRFGLMMSLSPVLFFALSIPIAFVSTGVAIAVWFLGIPFGMVAERWKPEGADELLLG